MGEKRSDKDVDVNYHTHKFSYLWIFFFTAISMDYVVCNIINL